MEQRTHYADDDTLAYIDHLERELAEAKAERDENGRLADNAQDGWRKSLEERQKLASYAEVLRTALAGLAQWEDLALEMAEPPHRTYYLKCIADAKAALAAEGEIK